jgi:hypothetical protein
LIDKHEQELVDYATNADQCRTRPDQNLYAVAALCLDFTETKIGFDLKGKRGKAETLDFSQGAENGSNTQLHKVYVYVRVFPKNLQKFEATPRPVVQCECE